MVLTPVLVIESNFLQNNEKKFICVLDYCFYLLQYCTTVEISLTWNMLPDLHNLQTYSRFCLGQRAKALVWR